MTRGMIVHVDLVNARTKFPNAAPAVESATCRVGLPS